MSVLEVKMSTLMLNLSVSLSLSLSFDLHLGTETDKVASIGAFLPTKRTNGVSTSELLQRSKLNSAFFVYRLRRETSF